MKHLNTIIIILLCACMLTGCAQADVKFEAEQESNIQVSEEQAAEAETVDSSEADPLEAWIEEIEEESKLLKAELEQYFAEVLPKADGEKLVPYIGDIYYHGDCTLLNYAHGLGTVGGKLITDARFCCVWPVLDRANANEQIYLCHCSDHETLAECWAAVSADGEFRGWADDIWAQDGLNSRWIDCGSDSSGLIYVGDKDGIGSVVDDGVYHLDVEYEDVSEEFWGSDREEGWVHLGFVDLGEGPYDICRNSDGKKVGTTERIDEWTEPDLYPFDSHEGRMYCTVNGDFFVMMNKDFEPVLRVSRTGGEPAEEPQAEETGSVEVHITERELCNLNIFLSNFSEQGFDTIAPFTAETSDWCDVDLLRFCYTWALINEPELISHEASQAIMSREAIEGIVAEKFGPLGYETEPAENGYTFGTQTANGGYWCGRYEHGIYYFQIEENGNYNRFSVVESVAVEGDRLNVRFKIYEVNLQDYNEAKGVPSDYYFMTPERAPDFVKAGKISFVGEGSAVCSFDWSAEGEHTNFRLLRYELY